MHSVHYRSNDWTTNIEEIHSFKWQWLRSWKVFVHKRWGNEIVVWFIFLTLRILFGEFSHQNFIYSVSCAVVAGYSCRNAVQFANLLISGIWQMVWWKTTLMETLLFSLRSKRNSKWCLWLSIWHSRPFTFCKSMRKIYEKSKRIFKCVRIFMRTFRYLHIFHSTEFPSKDLASHSPFPSLFTVHSTDC